MRRSRDLDELMDVNRRKGGLRLRARATQGESALEPAAFRERNRIRLAGVGFTASASRSARLTIVRVSGQRAPRPPPAWLGSRSADTSQTVASLRLRVRSSANESPPRGPFGRADRAARHRAGPRQRSRREESRGGASGSAVPRLCSRAHAATHLNDSDQRTVAAVHHRTWAEARMVGHPSRRDLRSLPGPRSPADRLRSDAGV